MCTWGRRAWIIGGLSETVSHEHDKVVILKLREQLNKSIWLKMKLTRLSELWYNKGEGVPRKRGEIEKKEPWQRDLIRQLKGRISN